MPGFAEVVNEAWNDNINHVEPCQCHFHKLKSTDKKLMTWSKSLFSEAKAELHIRLDVAQESRALNNDERYLRVRLMRRVIGLAALERSRGRGKLQDNNVKGRGADTRFLHLCVNARRRMNHIIRLKHNNGWVMKHDQTKSIVHNHFKNIIRKGHPRGMNFNWATICELSSLNAAFTEDELKPRWIIPLATRLQGRIDLHVVSLKLLGTQ
jgi:hypothetical protein